MLHSSRSAGVQLSPDARRVTFSATRRVEKDNVRPHRIAGHWNNVHRMLNELRWWTTYLKEARTPAPPGAIRSAPSASVPR